jgi:hypothetical protein
MNNRPIKNGVSRDLIFSLPYNKNYISRGALREGIREFILEHYIYRYSFWVYRDIRNSYPKITNKYLSPIFF